jgi:hypothetical protein
MAALALVLPAFAGAQEGEQVTLKLDRYAELLAKAQRGSGVQAAWGDAKVRVTLPGEAERFAEVALEARLTVVGEHGGDVVLLPADAVLTQATIDGNAAAVVPLGGAQAAVLEPGSYAAALRYLVPVTAADGARLALLPLPALAGAELTVTGDENAEVSPAAAVQRSGGTVTAHIPAVQTVAVRWGAAEGGHAVRRIDYALSVDDSGDGMDVAAAVEVELESDRADVRLARDNAALIDVREGATPLTPRVVDGWHVATLRGRGRKTLQVRFRLPIDRSQGQPQVVLNPDRAPITRLELTIAGARTVQVDPAVPLATKVQGQGDHGVTHAVANLPPTAEVTVRWTESRNAPEQVVRANTETYQLVTLQEGVLRSRVIVRYDVIRGKLRELPIRLPDDVVLYKVTGDGVDDWRTFAPQDGEPRQVKVSLAREAEGQFGIELQLEAVAPRVEGAPVTIPVVRPLGAFRETGVVALFDGDKVGFAEANPNGYTKVGQDALPLDVRQGLTDKVSQAFKHIGEPGPIASKVATAKAREVRFDAHTDALYQVREGSLLGNASVLVEIKSGRRDSILLSLPEGVAEPRITAPSLNKVEPAPAPEQGRRGYEVRFTQALEGAVQLDVEFEMLLPRDLGRIRVPDVRVHGAEVEDGNAGITAETGMEVQQAEVKDLRSVTVEELPKAVRLRSDRDILLGYQYAHAPWALDLEVKRHKTVETLKAVISRAWIETHVLESGHLVSRATFEVANEDRQFLQLALPENSRVLTVSAGGAAVKAVADEQGAIKIPLPRGTKLLVDVIYEVSRSRLGYAGGLDLVMPKADLRLGDLQWLLTVPARYSLYGLDTDLKEQPSYLYQPPQRPADGAASMFELPPGESFDQKLFTYAVLDPSETPPNIALAYVAGAAGTLDVLLLAAAVALLGVVTWRRARGRPMDRPTWALLIGGLVLLVAQAALGSLTWIEGLAAVVVLVVLAIAARRRRAPEVA